MPYTIVPFKALALSGFPLRVMTALSELPGIGAAIAAKFFSDIGVNQLRATDARGLGWAAHPVFSQARTSVTEDSEAVADSAAACRLPRAEQLPFETAADFIDAYNTGRTTPLKVALEVIAWHQACEIREPALRAIIAMNAEDVVKQGRISAARYELESPLGPMDGVPVVVKDEMDLVPYPTTVGSRLDGVLPAKADAEIVARLRRAGALLIGKANMHELGLGVTGINPHLGTARNPYNPLRMTGGSSSGPAAAVAAGYCPIGLGADAGGSIRIPSAFCGVFGLKPTFGRLSERGVAPLCMSMGHVGPIASSARDLALAYAVIAGRDPGDPNTHHQPAPTLAALDQPIAGLRLGIYRPWFEDATPAVLRSCKMMLDALAKAGAEIVEIEIPDLHLLRTIHLVTIASEILASQWDAEGRRRAFNCDLRMNFALSRYLSGRDYVHAQRLRADVCQHFYSALASVDAIVTPTVGVTAPEIPVKSLTTGLADISLTDRIMRFITAANLTGLPAVTFPAGYDEYGLPIGFQAIGRAWEEDLLLRIAAEGERAVLWRHPPIHRHLLPD